MPVIVFYEKPGCINNNKQKKLLIAAGYHLQVKNLLSESWDPEVLRQFFGSLPVNEWFNQSAPAVKNNELDIHNLTESEALALMQKDPILIRRPLMQLDDIYKVGFDQNILQELLGVEEQVKNLDLETCPR